MTEPDVVVRTRQALIRTTAIHEWPNPEMLERVTRDLLALVATVPYRGDDDAYMLEAWETACTMMNPLVEQLRADAFFRQMKTSKTIQ